jgi:hypothetical protein
MRLIDADELMRHAEAYSPIQAELCGYYDFAWLVDSEPTVGVVEVVRCKDCRYSYGNKYCTNEAWKGEGNTVTIESDAFCSYGEKRNEHET